MKSIAIERQFGSGGRETGIRAAELAGIPYYDTELIKKAAAAQGVAVDMLEYFDEKRSGSFLYDVASYMNYASGGGHDRVHELFCGMQKTIRDLEKQGPAVFIGRCTTELLKDRNVLRVYIYSSDQEERAARIMSTEHVTEYQARQMMEKKDKERKNYCKYWTQKDWADRNNYDLELNTAGISTKECAKILVAAIQ